MADVNTESERKDTPLSDSVIATTPDASLVNTYWKLTELNGHPVILIKGQRELHIVLTMSQENTVRGFAGCNRFHGVYKQDSMNLSFAQLISTRMACQQGMNQEHEFLQALASIMRYEISGDHLDLYSNSGGLVLQFRAVYLQ